MTNPIHALDREQRKWAELREQLSGADWSEDELLSALESETDLTEALGDIDASLLDDETMLAGIDATIVKLEARAARYAKRIETKRNIILKAMEQAGLKTMPFTTGTLSIGPGGQSVVVFEQASLPDKYLKSQDPKVDKAALRRDLLAGTKIPGATLNNSPNTLTIRRS